MGLSQERCESSRCAKDLRQVQEFCAYFSSCAIHHDLLFEITNGLNSAWSLIEVDGTSGFQLLGAEYVIGDGAANLKVRLVSKPDSDIEGIWQNITAVPGASLLTWQTTARFEQSD